MARRVFFSFHYQRDIFRVNTIRKSTVVRPSDSGKSFHDSSIWEEKKKRGDAAIKTMINEALERTTVTCVLIGTETNSREYVEYEIARSREIGNGLLGVHIHNIKDATSGKTDARGESPFGIIDYLNGIINYDWVYECGRDHFEEWAEKAYLASPKAKRDADIKRRTSGSYW